MPWARRTRLDTDPVSCTLHYKRLYIMLSLKDLLVCLEFIALFLVQKFTITRWSLWGIAGGGNNVKSLPLPLKMSLFLSGGWKKASHFVQKHSTILIFRVTGESGGWRSREMVLRDATTYLSGQTKWKQCPRNLPNFCGKPYCWGFLEHHAI